MKQEQILRAVPIDHSENVAPQYTPEADEVPVEQFNGNHCLVRVIDFLEPIQFVGIRKSSTYGKFLVRWEKHVLEKLEGSTEMFDFSEVIKSSVKDFANQAELKAVRQSDYKVISTDIIMKTAEIIGHPIMFQMGHFFVFDGKRWIRFEDAELNGFIKVAGIRMRVDRMVAPDADFIQNMIKQMGSLVMTKPKGMMRNIINFNNGTLEIGSDGKTNLRVHRPEDLLHYVLPYDYDPTASCPSWQSFLDEVIPEIGKQSALAEFFGSCFSDVKHEKILMLYGTGANGKSVVMEVVIGLLGKSNVVHNTLEEITDEKGYNRGNLMTALLNFSGEISDRVNPDALKRLASREPMNGRYVRGKPFIVQDYCRSAFNCNVLPKVKEASDGYFRRFLIIPFEITIPEEKRNPELPFRIIESDLPGIMNWVINGLQRLLKSDGKFTTSAASERIMAQYKEASINVEIFVKDYCASHHGDIASTILYDAYKAFCITNEYTPVNTKEFSIQLQTAKCQRIRRRDGVYYRLPEVQGRV
jgi:putative DNA primase/helicase